MILACARIDGDRVKIRLPQDPGAAGVAWINSLARVLGCYDFVAERETGDKVTRAAGLIAQVAAGK